MKTPCDFRLPQVLLLICLLALFPIGANAGTSGDSTSEAISPCTIDRAGDFYGAASGYAGDIYLWNMQAIEINGDDFRIDYI